MRRVYLAIGGVVVGVACLFALLAVTGSLDPQRGPRVRNNANDAAQIAARERRLARVADRERRERQEARFARELALDQATVTADEFRLSRVGMTYDQVVERISFRGEVLSQSEIAGVRTVMYRWANDDGSNMTAIFQDGRLVSKAQFGLR